MNNMDCQYDLLLLLLLRLAAMTRTQHLNFKEEEVDVLDFMMR